MEVATHENHADDKRCDGTCSNFMYRADYVVGVVSASHVSEAPCVRGLAAIISDLSALNYLNRRTVKTCHRHQPVNTLSCFKKPALR